MTAAMDDEDECCRGVLGESSVVSDGQLRRSDRSICPSCLSAVTTALTYRPLLHTPCLSECHSGVPRALRELIYW